MLGFLQQQAWQNETLGREASVIARGVTKLEGQKFTMREQAVGWERGLCVWRREKARDAQGKEDLWAGGGGAEVGRR